MSRLLARVACCIAAQWLVVTGVAASQAATVAPTPPVAVVKDLYTAFNRGDIAHILTLLSPDVVWIFHGPESVIPYAGVYKGRAGVQQFFADVAATIEVRKVAEQQFITSGDQVAVIGWERSEARDTGGQFVAHWIHLFSLNDGQIVRFEEFTDTAAIAAALAPADAARGKGYFITCAGCHGRAAQGSRYMHAPNLTVQGAQYLLTQLRDFYDGTRGGPQDFYGWQMNGRAKALPDDRALRDVIAYIETLPKVHPTPTLHVDTATGKALYQNCTGCHGVHGEGGGSFGAPALAGLNDWYVIEQLDAYRAGRRGTHRSSGAGMRAAALSLRTERAVGSVAAYIATFPITH